MPDRIILPADRLKRTVYSAVNKVLTGIDGKWNTSKQAHLFAVDPRPKIGAILATGKPINEKKERQAFFTPPELAEKIVSLADVAGHRVLEPSAGAGALVEVCLTAGATQVDCIEANEEHRPALIGLRRVVTIADFLSTRPYRSFSRVVMNPPFSKNQDIAHFRAALKWLKPKGVIVSVMAWNQTRSAFRRLVGELKAVDVIELPAGAFKASGTSVASLLLRASIE